MKKDTNKISKKNDDFDLSQYSKKAMRYFYMGIIIVFLYNFIEPQLGSHYFSQESIELTRTPHRPFVCSDKIYDIYCGYVDYAKEFLFRSFMVIVFYYIPLSAFLTVTIGIILKAKKKSGKK